MRILGLATGSHDASYAIMEDGVLIKHVEIERLTRIKEDPSDPIQTFLKLDGHLKIDKIRHYATTWRGGMMRYYAKSMRDLASICQDYNEIGHHTLHAANALFSSPFKDAAILTIDGGGEEIIGDDIFAMTCGLYTGEDRAIKIISSIAPETLNIGNLWDTTSEKVLGLYKKGHGNQAGTIMAMAAFGEPKFMDQLTDGKTTTQDMRALLVTEQDRFDLAASVQLLTEEILLSMAEEAREKTGKSKLCIGGGVALNCVAIGKIIDKGIFDEVFVPNAPYDAGLAVGACQYTWHVELDNPRDYKLSSPYNGGSYKLDKDIGKKVSLEEVVELLAQGKIIAVYHGRSECGRRALGNRSILADPRRANMKDLINAKVKHRQPFRPFAPSILKEHVLDWFYHDFDSPYMTVAGKIREDKQDQVPAIVHKDGTARLHTVTAELNPTYHKLISLFYLRTGVPMVLNTSFNDKEPIVETPTDAINCFNKTDIDYLYFVDEETLISK